LRSLLLRRISLVVSSQVATLRRWEGNKFPRDWQKIVGLRDTKTLSCRSSEIDRWMVGLLMLYMIVGERGASWQGHFLWIYLNFLTTRFANWMNKSNSDFNSLWIDRICLQCSFTRNWEIGKNWKKNVCQLAPPTG
jgi:hypothetical protein